MPTRILRMATVRYAIFLLSLQFASVLYAAPALPEQYYARVVARIRFPGANSFPEDGPDWIRLEDFGALSLCDLWCAAFCPRALWLTCVFHAVSRRRSETWSRYDGATGRILLECQEQQATQPHPASGRNWTWLAYGNGTTLHFCPEGVGRWCEVTDNGPGQLLPQTWTDKFTDDRPDWVNNLECDTYYWHAESFALDMCARYAISREGIPVSWSWGVGTGPNPPEPPFIRLDVLTFRPGVKAAEDQFAWPGFCPSAASEAAAPIHDLLQLTRSRFTDTTHSTSHEA